MFAKTMSLAKSDIDRAFAQDEIGIVLQPQIEVSDGAVVAAEAFVRWNHPTFGTMTPQLFLPFIDAHGESPRLLAAVVNKAVQAARAFTEAGRPWRVSVNLGVSDLQTGVAPDVVSAALRESGVPARQLVLEAPEAALSEGDAIVRMSLKRLRDMGCRIALDSGAALPLDAAESWPELFSEIKIGGAAILRFAEIARKVDGGRIARRLAFAKKHGLSAVAVGVEQEKTLSALVKLGFGAVQGALIAKPQTLESLLAWDGGWAGEVATAPAVSETQPRPRPRLVVPVEPDAKPEPAAAKLVDGLMPTAADFAFDEDDDEGMDVGFDDDAFEAPPPVFTRHAVEDADVEFDPSEDMQADSEELSALENAAPLHAGMIDRPKKRTVQREAAPAYVPPPMVAEDDVPEVEAPVFDRTLSIRVKQPAPKQSLMQKLGLKSLLGR
jgi:EAL domain-containing protein (putative c-di-GMP-specific phosphodiesterase class I)